MQETILLLYPYQTIKVINLDTKIQSHDIIFLLIQLANQIFIDYFIKL